jgi:reverse gyrase
MKCIDCTGVIRPVKYDKTIRCEYCFQYEQQQYPSDAEIQDEIEALRTINGSKVTQAVLYSDYY